MVSKVRSISSVAAVGFPSVSGFRGVAQNLACRKVPAWINFMIAGITSTSDYISNSRATRFQFPC